MERVHFWQGEWIDEPELERRISRLSEAVRAARLAEPDTEAVLAAADRLGAELAADSPLRARLKEALSRSEDAPSGQELDGALSEVAKLLGRASLEAKLRRELGSLRPSLPSRIRYDEAIFEAWRPLGLLLHVSPQNSFAVGPMSVLEGLLSGNVNFLKTGASETLFPQLLLEALCERDPTGGIASRVIVARISSRRKELLEKIFASCDGIAAWGGEESVQSIRKMAPPGARVIEWGHKISFAYVTRSRMADPLTLENLARECCNLEQQACSSPQCVYLDTSDWEELRSFGQALARALEQLAPGIARIAPSDNEAAEITKVTECHRAHSIPGATAPESHQRGEVMQARDLSWRILLDERPALAASPLFGTIWLKPLPRAEIADTLHPMRSYLQTCGLGCGLGELAELTSALLASGVERVRGIGGMLGGYAGEPHDGVYALQRYSRRVTLQLGEETRGISSFDELRRLPSPFANAERLPSVTPKEKFRNQPREESQARLFFKSGGSTGEPKLSTFSYEQYHEQMRLGAEGLYAAGFDPLRDRAMNLFFGGGLYGGFLSFFSALEALEAVQFPMAAIPDFEMVARTIVKNRVNVLLGMPSYLLQLFEKAAGVLETYRGIEKIFYGGEHFSESQKRYLTERFGVAVIRSGAYGSVDIGPLGFQCERCDGGVHHLQQKLQYLEILRLEEDAPVQGEEVGRLVFTPRGPESNKPLRYEIGDVGHWISDPGGICPCGRASPRFRLLGRMGDVFRVGSMFLNYRKFSQILSSEAGYRGELQILLQEEGLREKAVLRVLEAPGMAPEECRELCLRHYDDLREAVVQDGTLAFEVLPVGIDSFERTPGSGKLIRVLDRRSRA